VTQVWPTVPLGEVISLSQDEHRVLAASSYPNVGIYSFGRGVFEKPPIEGATTSARTLFRIRAKQFIYSRLFAFEGAYGLVPDVHDRSFVSNEFPSFDVDQKRLCPEFLALHFKLPSTWKTLAARTVGMGDRRQRIKPDQLLSYEIPLPPLAEQRRIVAKIERLAAKIDEARGLSKNCVTEAEKLPASWAHHLFSDELVAVADSVPLGEIADVQSGVTLGRQVRGPSIELPYLRVANVQDGFLDLGIVKTIAIYEDEKEKWLLKRGDILLTEGGDWDKLGRGTVWHEEIPNCIHQNHIFRVRIDQHAFDPRYIIALTSSPYGKEYFQGASKQTTNLASINQRQLKAFPVYRLPILEQRRIVAYLDGLGAKVDRLKALQAQTRAELDALLPSILDRAFKGEL
jgi:type I restriction enzyme, S subunit